MKPSKLCRNIFAVLVTWSCIRFTDDTPSTLYLLKDFRRLTCLIISTNMASSTQLYSERGIGFKTKTLEVKSLSPGYRSSQILFFVVVFLSLFKDLGILDSLLDMKMWFETFERGIFFKKLLQCKTYHFLQCEVIHTCSRKKVPNQNC